MCSEEAPEESEFDNWEALGNLSELCFSRMDDLGRHQTSVNTELIGNAEMVKLSKSNCLKIEERERKSLRGY